MLTGLGGGDDLRRMMLVRRGQNDGLDVVTLERILEARSRLEPCRLGRFARRVGGLDAEHGPNDLASGKLPANDVAPPAQADDGRFDHENPPVSCPHDAQPKRSPHARNDFSTGPSAWPFSVRKYS